MPRSTPNGTTTTPRRTGNKTSRDAGGPLARIEAARRRSAARRHRAVESAVRGAPATQSKASQTPARWGRMIEALEGRAMLSASWFVATTGSDSNGGGINAPFATIQHAASVAEPGDTVFVRAGTYHETVTPHNSGTAGDPIIFTPYKNESVTIDGADAITGWTAPNDGNIYSAQMPWDLGAGNNQVFVDGQMMNEARWPNTGFDLSDPTLATATGASAAAGSNTATLYDPALTQPAGFWDGATIHVANGQGWVAQTGTVTDYQPGQITFTYQNNGSYETTTAGNHYYLTGKAGALDGAGEWYRDANGQLSLWTPAGDSPSQHVVEARHREFAFDLSGRSNIEIDGFNLFASTINTDSNSSNIVIDGISAKYVTQFTSMPNGWAWQSQSGIILRGSNDVLENSEIAYSAGDGVYVAASGSRVINNVIHDVDYQGGDSAGVQVVVPDVTVQDNTIYNAGRDGILVQSGHGSVTHNLIHDFGLQTTDVGGIYTVHIDGNGEEFAYNRIYNGSSGGFGSVGVYLDNYSSDFVVDHNITWNVTSGMKLNFTSYNERVYNNTLSGTQASVAKMWGGWDWSGTVFENNIFTTAADFGLNTTVKDNWNGDPGFVDGAGGNFALGAGSSAINIGLDLGQYTTGYVGTAPDLGALEYGAPAPQFGAKQVAKPVIAPPTPPADPTPVVVTPPTTPVVTSAPTTTTTTNTTTTTTTKTTSSGGTGTGTSSSTGSSGSSTSTTSEASGATSTTTQNPTTSPAPVVTVPVVSKPAPPPLPPPHPIVTTPNTPTSTDNSSTTDTSTTNGSTASSTQSNVTRVASHGFIGPVLPMGPIFPSISISLAATKNHSKPTVGASPAGAHVANGNVRVSHHGSYIECASINFGAGVHSVTLQIAHPNRFGGRHIELRIDGRKGKLIGTVITKADGRKSDVYTLQTTAIAATNGVHSLFITFGAHPRLARNIEAIQFN